MHTQRDREPSNHQESKTDIDTQIAHLYPDLKERFEHRFHITFTPIEAASLRRHIRNILTEQAALNRSKKSADSESLFHAELLARFLLDYGIHIEQIPSRGVLNVFRDPAFEQYFHTRRMETLTEEPTPNPFTS